MEDQDFITFAWLIMFHQSMVFVLLWFLVLTGLCVCVWSCLNGMAHSKGVDDAPKTAKKKIPRHEIKKVIIIGGGVSGLSAANALAKFHMTNFLILESRNRLGGRMCGIDIGRLYFCVSLSSHQMV